MVVELTFFGEIVTHRHCINRLGCSMVNYFIMLLNPSNPFLHRVFVLIGDVIHTLPIVIDTDAIENQFTISAIITHSIFLRGTLASRDL